MLNTVLIKNKQRFILRFWDVSSEIVGGCIVQTLGVNNKRIPENETWES